jgi:hypothetical protein
MVEVTSYTPEMPAQRRAPAHALGSKAISGTSHEHNLHQYVVCQPSAAIHGAQVTASGAHALFSYIARCVSCN